MLTAIYSWDDVVHGLLFLISKKSRRHLKHKFFFSSNDHNVTVMLMFFAIPLSLIYFLNSSGSLFFKLNLLIIELLAIAILAKGMVIFQKRIKHMNHYHGLEKIGALAFASAGFISPTFRLFYRHATNAPELVAKFALYLSLPMIAASIIAWFGPRDVITGDLLPNMNSLLAVAVGGLIILITIKAIEQYHKLYKFDLVPYARVLLGIVLIFVLSEGLA